MMVEFKGEKIKGSKANKLLPQVEKDRIGVNKIYLFSKYLLSTFYVSGTLRDPVVTLQK